MNLAITEKAAQEQLDLFAQKRTGRISSIDLLRGFIMIIMALDHTRDFFHITAWTLDPVNLAQTTPILYATRWITHLCAPNFVFLAGVSIFFQSQRKHIKELSIFLIKRGIWLLLAEVFIVNFAFGFDIYFSFVALQVIWAIGISMILIGLIIRLPFAAILTTGALIVLGHNLLDFYEQGFKNQPAWWYSLLHIPGIYSLSKNHNLFIFYPFLPWTGLMILGYCFGKLFVSFEGVKRKRMLILLGSSLILFFIVLRYTNAYGDPRSWAVQKNGLYTFFSFINLQKYPPSLLFMCATIGPALLLLAITGNANNRLSRFITVYGRVPFLYYILHFFLIHFVSSIFFFARGHSASEGIYTGKDIPNFIIPGEGVSLAVVYLIWVCVVLALYPVCKWFSEYKRNHKKWWLSYL